MLILSCSYRHTTIIWLWGVNAAASFVRDAVVRLRDKRKSICDQPSRGLAVLIPHFSSTSRIQKRFKTERNFLTEPK